MFIIKNTIIIPGGAKGAFFIKKHNLIPEEYKKDGLKYYKQFIRYLLKVTDSYKDNIIFDDPDDRYFVVAADKGTASFSDIANQISNEEKRKITNFQRQSYYD
jgi:glutamate dehydrogenase